MILITIASGAKFLFTRPGKMSGSHVALRLGGEAAVDEQRLASNEVGSTAGEKDRSAKEIRWLLKTAKFNAAQ